MSRAIHHLGVLVALFVLVGPIAASNAFASVTPAGAIVAPGASQQFTSSFPVFLPCAKEKPTWQLLPNASGGTISATGLYTAGSTENVTDRVVASVYHTGCSAFADVSVSVLKVSPAPVQRVEPGASQPFTVSGGSGTGYTWSFVTNASAGSLSAAGVYTAGATAGVDTLKVVDSVGHAATFTVVVYLSPQLSISPSSPTLAPMESLAFRASGGSPPYSWAIATNHSGGNVSTTGVYTAGAAGDTTDDVRVTDSLGVYVTAIVTVTTALSITPSGPTLAPVESQAFSASGGSPPYTWAIATNASGATLNGAGDAGIPEGPSVEYQAGAIGDVADAVRLTDSLGVSVSATVTVTAALSITPPGVLTLEAKSSHAFTASGGRGPYTWALATNASGGTVSESGEYTAGAKGNVTDVVQVTDSLGTSTTASVMVTSSGGCGTTDGGTFPLLALLVLPLLASRRKRSTQPSMTSASRPAPRGAGVEGTMEPTKMHGEGRQPDMGYLGLFLPALVYAVARWRSAGEPPGWAPLPPPRRPFVWSDTRFKRRAR